MAKMRVYDLAKELGIESKQIIETLNTTEYAVKAASSNIDDPAQDIVRKKFGKSAAAENTAKAQNKENVSESKPAENKTAAPENKPAQKPQANEQNKPAEGAKTENAEQRPKKKSSISGMGNTSLPNLLSFLYHSFALSAIFSCMARKRVVTLWERVQGFKNS